MPPAQARNATPSATRRYAHVPAYQQYQSVSSRSRARRITLSQATNRSIPRCIKPCATGLAFIDEKEEECAVCSSSPAAVCLREEYRRKQKGHTDAKCILVIADALPGPPGIALKNAIRGKHEQRREC